MKNMRRPLTEIEKRICEKNKQRLLKQQRLLSYELKRVSEDLHIGLALTIEKKREELEYNIRVKEEELRELNKALIELDIQIRDGVEIKDIKEVSK